MGVSRSCCGVVEAEDVSDAEAAQVFDAAMRAFRYFARHSRVGGSGTVRYDKGPGGGVYIQPSRVMPEDWMADLHVRGKIELGDRTARERIWSLHFCMGLGPTGPHGARVAIGLSGSDWDYEVRQVRITMGKALVRYGLWPIHDRISGRGYLD